MSLEHTDSGSTAHAEPGKCYLLSLPGELRNMIYQYALTGPDGLYFYRNSDSATFCAPQDKDVGMNQLQHTCRQLRRETLGLELEWNEVIFKSDAHRENAHLRNTAAVQFFGFLDLCSEAWRSRICRVRLKDPCEVIGIQHLSSYVDTLLQVSNWSRRYPKAIVFWELPLHWKPSNENMEFLLMDGLMLKLNLWTPRRQAKFSLGSWLAGGASYGLESESNNLAGTLDSPVILKNGTLSEASFLRSFLEGTNFSVSKEYVEECLGFVRIFLF